MKVKIVKTKLLEDIDVSKVKMVYSGRADTCRCGCAGTYYYSEPYVQQCSDERGYAVRAEKVNERMVRKVVNWLNAHKDECQVWGNSLGNRGEVIVNAYFSPVREYTAYIDDDIELSY